MSYSCVKKYRTKHKIKGICVDCINEAEYGKTRCKYHLWYQREWARKRRKVIWLKNIKPVEF
jgi:hypothetical protein